MCGIVMVITKNAHGFNKDEQDAFDNLLYIDALRGMDSTGVVCIDNAGNVDIAKEASAAHTFRGTKEYKDLQTLAFRKGAAMIGHNRSATKGSVKDENAHPFVVDNRITLIHNGTLMQDHKKLADVEVDSHAIAHTIHKHEDDVEAALQELTGAYALIWHDFKLGTINVVRNAQRPMHWIETDRGWIYASEQAMIEFVLHRFPGMKPIGKVASQPAGVLTTFTQKDKSWDVESKEIELVKPYVAPVYPIHVGGSQTGSTFRGGYNSNGYYDDEDILGWYKDENDQQKANVGKALGKELVLIPPGPAKTRREIEAYLMEMEEDVATNLDLNIDYGQFTSVEGIQFSEYYAGKYVEYASVDHQDPSKGYYLYATCEKYKQFMIRILYKNFEPNCEYDLLDKILNGGRVLFKVSGKSWRAYKDKSRGAGYGMLFATSEQPILEAEDKFVEGLV